ncbi:ankyrin repeat domain-containing protein [Noviherbaspirillum sp. 1P10PC]|uniref:ankyrin repeat domain-containing protein n=1 Tax=Noviherbaspirillum sp. 1P10PC TaxID=3132292 RepID=UPI0039A149BF
MQASNAVTPPAAVSSRRQQATPSATGDASPSQPLLYQACRDGDATAAKRLLAAGGVQVNAVDPDTRLTPLMLAARHGHDDVTLVLIKGAQGADVNLLNSRGDSALSLAAGAGRDEVVELLLLKKAQPDQASHGGRTPLAYAAAGGHLHTATLLLATGAQVNGSGKGGKPPLAIAAQRGDSALAALLLENKASLDLADRHGWTAFHHAAAMGHVALAERLRGKGAAQLPLPAAQRPEADGQSAAGKESGKQSEQGVVPGGASSVTTTATVANVTTASTTATAITVATTTATSTATTVTSIVATQPAYVAPAAPAMPAMPVGPAMESPTALRKAVERNDVEALHQIVAAHPGQRATLNQPIAFTRQRGPLPAGSYTLLMLAAVHGHVAMVEALLALGVDVNARGSADRTALMLAVDNRRLDVAETLLKAGAEVDAQAADGSTAVMLALARRDPVAVSVLLQGVRDAGDIGSCLRQAAASGHVNTVRLLLKAGADVNGFDDVEGKKKGIPSYDDIQNAHVRGDFYYQQRCQAARRYYDHKGAWNPFVEKEWADSLALFRAARNGHAAVVQALVDAGAKVDGPYTIPALISQVITKGDIETILILLAARYSSQWRDHDSAPPELGELMSWAIRNKHPALLRDLLGSRAGKAAAWNIPWLLEQAIHNDQPDMVRMLLDAGASLTRQKDNQQLPLLSAAYSAGVEVVAMLLDAGASFDEACQSSGYSPLSVAARDNSADVVKLFLKLALKASDARKLLDIALWDACKGVSRKGERTEIAQMLLDAGAEFKGYDGDDIQQLLDEIVQDYHADQLLEGASEDASVPRGRAAVVQLLLKHKADVNHDPGKESAYPSPLFAAVWTGKTAIVRVLLEAGAKTDLKDRDGRTALQHAVKNEYREIEALLRNGGPKTA